MAANAKTPTFGLGYGLKAKIIIPVVYLAGTVIILAYVLAVRSSMMHGVTPFFTDLRAQPTYVRDGFDPEDIDALPDLSEGVWWEFPHSAAGAALRIRDAGLPDV